MVKNVMIKDTLISKYTIDKLTEQELNILSIAKEEFQKIGYHAVNIDVIANKAGIGKGTVYRHFGSKSDLFYYTLVHSLKEDTSKMDLFLSEIKNPYEAFSILLDKTISQIISKEISGNSLLWQAHHIDCKSSDFELSIVYILDNMVDKVSVLIGDILSMTEKKDINPKIMANFMFSSLSTFIFMQIRYKITT